jgi:DUF438 domain-containing protein
VFSARKVDSDAFPKGGEKMNNDHNEPEVIARQMIASHGPRAPDIAVEHLNECIDQGNKQGRDYWVQVFYQIHRLRRGPGPNW